MNGNVVLIWAVLELIQEKADSPFRKAKKSPLKETKQSPTSFQGLFGKKSTTGSDCEILKVTGSNTATPQKKALDLTSCSLILFEEVI